MCFNNFLFTKPSFAYFITIMPTYSFRNIFKLLVQFVYPPLSLFQIMLRSVEAGVVFILAWSAMAWRLKRPGFFREFIFVYVVYVR